MKNQPKVRGQERQHLVGPLQAGAGWHLRAAGCFERWGLGLTRREVIQRTLCPKQTHAEPLITGAGPAQTSGRESAQTPGGESAVGHNLPLMANPSTAHLWHDPASSRVTLVPSPHRAVERIKCDHTEESFGKGKKRPSIDLHGIIGKMRQREKEEPLA